MTRTIRTPGAAAAAAVETHAEADAAPAEVAAADDSLPNAIDIDPRAIKGPVMTRQGWVCPVESPRPPLR